MPIGMVLHFAVYLPITTNNLVNNATNTIAPYTTTLAGGSRPRQKQHPLVFPYQIRRQLLAARSGAIPHGIQQRRLQ